jgi:predicted double-glycine peptidase
LKELRDQYVVKQQFDFSCGAAALATLLTYYFGDPTSEQDVLKLLMAQLPKDDKLQKTRIGFSLLDLKHIAEAKGYRAAGFKLTIEQLMQLAAPVIVFVQPLGYPHFAVLRGIDRGRVFLAKTRRKISGLIPWLCPGLSTSNRN